MKNSPATPIATPIRLARLVRSFSMLIAALIAVLIAVPAASGQTAVPSQPERFVEDNVLHSTALPGIRVRVDDAFAYLGKFEFTLKEMAYGERHVFADTSEGKVERLFIFQFEGFLPGIDQTYNYDFTGAEVMAGFPVRQNTWAYSNEQALRENPQNEGALTARFVRSRGLELEDELMMSRFVMLADDDRRHELILFYLENASATGHRITTFYDAQGAPSAHWRTVSEGLEARSRASFTILE